ncbi:MAG: glycosyltransferase [Bradyrhizobium sp.]
MRLFENSRYYPSLRPKIRQLIKGRSTFADQIAAVLSFRESAAHILLPVDQRAEWAFFANGTDEILQRNWARERGMNPRASLGDILHAQIEEHRTEVFYNLDVTSWEAGFARRLPGCVRKKIAWHAVALKGVSFEGYDLVVCNFPSILAQIAATGVRTAYFFPAFDRELLPFAARGDRPIDVLFVGGYSRHHRRRAEVLEAVAELAGAYNIAYHLDRSRLCRLAESPLGRVLPLGAHRRPSAIRAISRDPIFGRDYYAALSAAKIVLNGAIDMSGSDRGNMRCFEALGGGALLLTDEGNYPEGMADGQTLATYSSPKHAVEQIRALLGDPARRLNIARAGHDMVAARYSKEHQWKQFQALVESI